MLITMYVSMFVTDSSMWWVPLMYLATYRYVLGVLRGANVFADYRQVAHEIRQHKGVRLVCRVYSAILSGFLRALPGWNCTACSLIKCPPPAV